MKPRERKVIFAWEERKRKERVRYCHLQEDTENMCKTKERGNRTRKKKKKELPRGSLLEKKKTTKRELCVEKKIKRREQSVAAFER